MSGDDDDVLDDHDDDVGCELAERERRAVSCAVRVVSRNPGHTRVSVFSGRNEGARGHSGELVFRTDEWAELVDGAGAGGGIDSEGRLVLRFDVLPEPG